MKAKQIVFKVGTSSLTNADGSLSRAKVKEITRQLALLHEAGHELILVSSGAIAAGFSSLGFKSDLPRYQINKLQLRLDKVCFWRNIQPIFI